MTIKKHGGKRLGAGRKELPDGQKKQPKTYSLAPDVIEFLDTHRPASQTIEKAVREYAKQVEKLKGG